MSPAVKSVVLYNYGFKSGGARKEKAHTRQHRVSALISGEALIAGNLGCSGGCGQRAGGKHVLLRLCGLLGCLSGLALPAVKFAKLLPSRKHWVFDGASRQVADSALPNAYVLGDLGLSEPNAGQFRDELFPVHAFIISIAIRLSIAKAMAQSGKVPKLRS